MPKKSLAEMSIMEAVENLTNMAEMENFQSRTDKSAEQINKKKSDSPQSSKEKNIVDTVKKTFQTVHNYLKHVYQKEKKHLEDAEMQKGIQAIMMLASEAADKVDSYSPLFKKALGQGGVKDLKEYQELQDFYLNKLLRRFQEAQDVEQAWQEQWGSGEEDLLDIKKRGLKDLETVKRDKEYELFYIRKEDGNPFFTKNLIRHIKLVTDFDELVTDITGDDPLLRIAIVKDKNANYRAQEIRELLLTYLDYFFTQALKRKHEHLTTSLMKCVMALFLAANSQNLRQQTTSKTCLQYFQDFIFYLRYILSCNDYLNLLHTPPTEEYGKNILKLIHAICFTYYTHREGKIDAIDYIEQLLEKYGSGKKMGGKASIAFWNQLLDDHESIQQALKQYPSGPLLKTIDVLYQQSGGFDPIKEQNFPYRQFDITYPGGRAICLKVPSPTNQEIINKAKIIEEFEGFLRFDTMENGKYVAINLQDRTSWQESARSHCLEELQRRGEFINKFMLITLAKDTDFYTQSGIYENQTSSELFFMNFKDQILSAEAGGFYFPKEIKGKKLEDFISSCLLLIHEVFFSFHKQMDKKKRLDCIEIFYFFFTLKIIEWLKPTLLSFICKDSVDTSAAANVQMYAMTYILKNSKPIDEVEKEFILWMLFAPSLLVRERVVDAPRVHRAISAISVFHASLEKNRALVLEKFSTLFESSFFTMLQADML